MFYDISSWFKGANLGIELNNRMYYGVYGVRFDGPNEKEDELIEKLAEDHGSVSWEDNQWLWWAFIDPENLNEEVSFKDPDKSCLLFLVNEEERKKFAERVSVKLIEVWMSLRSVHPT